MLLIVDLPRGDRLSWLFTISFKCLFLHWPRLGECAGRWQHWAVILNWCNTMLTMKRLGTCRTRGGSQGMYIIFTSIMQIRQNPLWLCPPQDGICICILCILKLHHISKFLYTAKMFLPNWLWVYPKFKQSTLYSKKILGASSCKS